MVNNGPGNDWFYIPDQEDQILFHSKHIYLLNIAEHPSSKVSETRASVDFFLLQLWNTYLNFNLKLLCVIISAQSLGLGWRCSGRSLLVSAERQ